MIRSIFWTVEDIGWDIRCRYNLWLHGPYGLAKVIEKIPLRFLIKYLRRYGASIGVNCRFERGLNIHRPLTKKPFENLVIGDNVYLGHNMLIDLTGKVEIQDNVIIASRCQIWTHASYYAEAASDHPKYGEHYGGVTIEKGALLYSGVVVSSGITIGAYSVTGANSLINKNIVPLTFVGGVPARLIRKID
jgi:acetyltransferase-like isoleucine patch superfamily enzyme